jgi:bacterioferritin
MQGNPKVVAALNQALSAELTAIAQYMVHAEMLSNWGYARLGGLIKKQAIDEMKHAEGLIERLLFLDAAPQIAVQLQPKIGKTVAEQIANDLAAETEAIHMYNASVKACSGAGDNGTRDLFEQMVKDEEQHADWLESQQHMIKEMGYDNYLAQQLKNG